MHAKLLLTSFATWEPHQRSNSSDDLLQAVAQHPAFPNELVFLRQLPVDFRLAPERVLRYWAQWQPQGLICCGMAEGRSKLSVESQGRRGEDAIASSLDLDALVAGLRRTEISHDAGTFVCNHLYYEVLRYGCDRAPQAPCLFIHVPVLTAENSAGILADFLQILRRTIALIR